MPPDTQETEATEPCAPTTETASESASSITSEDGRTGPASATSCDSHRPCLSLPLSLSLHPSPTSTGTYSAVRKKHFSPVKVHTRKVSAQNRGTKDRCAGRGVGAGRVPQGRPVCREGPGGGTCPSGPDTHLLRAAGKKASHSTALKARNDLPKTNTLGKS